jgi:type I restriction enzyme S subunit
MKQFNSEATETPFDMPETPEGWEIVLFGRIAQIIGGGTPKTSDNGNFSERGYPWITPADLSGFNEMYISWGRRSLSEQGLKTSSAVLLPEGTVLMSSRAPIGYLAIAANELCTNQGFKSFICPPGVLPEYVFFWLKFITPFLEDMGSGSTFLEISGSRARKIPILLAPTSEQKRIIPKVKELLARVNTAKERLNKVPKILKRFRQAILAAACSARLTADWREQQTILESASVLLKRLQQQHLRMDNDVFSENDLPEIPENWVWAKVGQLGNVITGSTPSKKEASYFGGSIPFFKPTDLDAGYNVEKSIDSLTEEGAEIARILTPLAVMVTCIGATIGKTGLARVAGATNQQINSVVTNREFVSPYWLFWTFTSPWVQEQIKLHASETTLPILNKGRFEKLFLPLPPLNEQQEIVRRVESIFKLAEAVEKRVATATARAEKLTQSILAKAFRGELVPTEAELARREGRSYGTASDLLTRIKSEKEKTSPKKNINPRG